LLLRHHRQSARTRGTIGRTAVHASSDEKQNGAPTGEKHVILYNPPIINAELGLRGSAVMAARDAAITFLARGCADHRLRPHATDVWSCC
jgi:hypothetical protein